ncbi:hypothetical protein Tco_0727393 [Tanacetum coccineum]|uniref:Uncharacterized protein n=1 Tax=Tanacetum coccineum TaxID=301880 RepID=A0ABQ4YKR1_9ASTR
MDVGRPLQPLSNPLGSSGCILVEADLRASFLVIFSSKELLDLQCVHPELPTPNQTIHEPPAGKIGVYTRFFEYANFRLPLSTFLVDVLRRTVPLLPVAVARDEGELTASVDKLFGEGESVEKGDSAEGGDRGEEIEPTATGDDAKAEIVVSKKPKGRKLKRQATGSVSEHNHPPKNLLDSSHLPAEIGVAAIPTVPFVSLSVTPTLERVGGDHTDSITKPNLHTTLASERSSAPSVVTAAVVVSVPIPETAAKVVSPTRPSIFLDSALTEWNVLTNSLLDNNAIACEFIYHLAPPALFGQIRGMDYEQLFTKFNVGTARQACLSAELRVQTEYGLGERTRLESEADKHVTSLKAKDDEIESLKAQLLLKEDKAMEALKLRAQVKSVEQVHTHEKNTLQRENIALEKEKKTLSGKVTELQSQASDQENKLADANNVVASLQSEKDGLTSQVHTLETACSNLCGQVVGYENLKEEFEKIQDVQVKIHEDRVAKLNDDFVETCLHLEEKFYPRLLTTISDRRWLLTHGFKITIVKCLKCSEYLTALGDAISHAIKKGIQDGLVAGIDHGKAGRSLADVDAFNPSAEADFTSDVNQFRNVDFPLLAELSSHKDASVEDVMNVLRLEAPLADAAGLTDLQPDVDQLMVPIHRSPNQVVLGATSLSFALSVSNNRVKMTRENIAAQRLAILGVFVEPLSTEFITSVAGHLDSLPGVVATTIALSTTFASASSIQPLSVDDYEVMGADAHGKPKLATFFRMAGFIASVHKIYWLEACTVDPRVVIFLHLGFALCLSNGRLFSPFLQKVKVDF